MFAASGRGDVSIRVMHLLKVKYTDGREDMLRPGYPVATVIAAVGTAREWRPSAGDRARLTILLAGAAIFLPWALYWGLLLP